MEHNDIMCTYYINEEINTQIDSSTKFHRLYTTVNQQKWMACQLLEQLVRFWCRLIQNEHITSLHTACN